MIKNIKINSKDISNYLQVSEPTAKKYLKDIKEQFNIKIVTEIHLKTYLKV